LLRDRKTTFETLHKNGYIERCLLHHFPQRPPGRLGLNPHVKQAFGIVSKDLNPSLKKLSLTFPVIAGFPSDKGDFMTKFTQGLKHLHNPQIETVTFWIRESLVDHQ
jgi:hypothetical protein